jgi:spore coat protein A
VSQAFGGECSGGQAELDDATWLYTFYDPDDVPGSPQWSNPGGDFTLTASASVVLNSAFGHKFFSTAQMAADVHDWTDNAASNHGWLLKRNSETGTSNALRFGSRQNPDPNQWPTLTVVYTPPATTGACCFPGQICQELSGGDCSAQNGTYQGAGTDCSPNPCPPDPSGACCFDDGSCIEVSQIGCNLVTGTYQGDGTSCATSECSIVLEPYVDALPIPAVAQPVTGSPGGAAHYEIAMREFQQQLHRDLPTTTLWGYGDGSTGATFPGPTIEATRDVPLSVDWINDLRDSTAAGDPKPLRFDHYLDVAGTDMPPSCHIHGAQDLPKAVVHLHGAHVQAEFDGYPELTYLPGNSEVYTYPNKQLPSLLWYHDHALGITRLNLYMGLAGAYIIRDAFEQGLGLPAGEFEIPLILQDRSFNPDGSLKYPSEWVEHFFGDKILVNGKIWPFHDVKQGKYRFRVLNGSGSRTYRLTLDRLDSPGPADVPFTQIGTDGGLMQTALARNVITLGPAERADIVIDFESMPPGTEVVLSNSAPGPFPGTPGQNVVPQVMKFVVQDQSGHTAALPANLRPLEVLQETDSIKVRDFTLDKEPDACGTRWTINGLGWDDVVEYPQLGTTEIWRFINPRNIMHPMHMHLVMFQVLDRQPIAGGAPIPPDPTEIGWKDTARADPQMITRVIARFEDYTGLYAYHCHIAEHEDHEMMRQFRTVDTIRLAVERTRLTWSAQPGATGYDVVRGDLALLVATDGSFAMRSVTQACVGHEPGTSTPETTPVPSGVGFWFLIRAVDAGGKGTYDTGHSSQVDRRDDEIAASGNDCP